MHSPWSYWLRLCEHQLLLSPPLMMLTIMIWQEHCRIVSFFPQLQLALMTQGATMTIVRAMFAGQ
jgi:hypothetical protein